MATDGFNQPVCSFLLTVSVVCRRRGWKSISAPKAFQCRISIRDVPRHQSIDASDPVSQSRRAAASRCECNNRKHGVGIRAWKAFDRSHRYIRTSKVECCWLSVEKQKLGSSQQRIRQVGGSECRIREVASLQIAFIEIDSYTENADSGSYAAGKTKSSEQPTERNKRVKIVVIGGTGLIGAKAASEIDTKGKQNLKKLTGES